MSSDSRWNEPDEMQDETGDGIAFRIANGDVYIAFSSGGPSMAVALGPQKQEEFAQLYVAVRLPVPVPAVRSHGARLGAREHYGGLPGAREGEPWLTRAR